VKPFIIALYAIFLVAMISGLMVAYRNAESLVEPDYYRKQHDWFHQKSEERRLDLKVRKPGTLSVGSNEVTFVLTEQGKPLRNARVRLFIGSVSKSDHDLTIAMRETATGVYTATVPVPSKGKWLVRMELDSDKLKTSRSWFYDVN
jgi:hypothetical protein